MYFMHKHIMKLWKSDSAIVKATTQSVTALTSCEPLNLAGYRIAGNFQGRKLWQIGRSKKFVENGLFGATTNVWVWPSIFTEKTFTDRPKTSKFIFSLESFPLYGISGAILWRLAYVAHKSVNLVLEVSLWKKGYVNSIPKSGAYTAKLRASLLFSWKPSVELLSHSKWATPKLINTRVWTCWLEFLE